MVIDTSAILAILLNESERRAFNEAIEESAARHMSVASFVEASMIIEARYGSDGVRDLDLWIARSRIALVSVDAEQGHLARQAFRRFGKGRHPAALNYGDCFAYALARSLGEPLLCKGRDFARCDIERHPAGT
jgi:ribonuclease VapC